MTIRVCIRRASDAVLRDMKLLCGVCGWEVSANRNFVHCEFFHGRVADMKGSTTEHGDFCHIFSSKAANIVSVSKAIAVQRRDLRDEELVQALARQCEHEVCLLPIAHEATIGVHVASVVFRSTSCSFLIGYKVPVTTPFTVVCLQRKVPPAYSLLTTRHADVQSRLSR